MSSEFGSGSALSFALLSVDSLERSVEFYRDIIGLTPGIPVSGTCGLASDAEVERSARLVLVGEPATPVGRILLVEFSDPGPWVRRAGDRTTRGLWNLNFYVDDIAATTRVLRARGLPFWADPETYEVGVEAGTATEVVFEGPDGVAINLVDPRGGPDTFTGRVRAEVARHGMTRTGFTPVATTAHCLHDAKSAVDFYRHVLGMRIVLDEILGKPATNRFLCRPATARAHTVFLAGGHFFGKVSVNQPLNFEVPERVAAAHAPNVGYLAQGFEVSSLNIASRSLTELGIAHVRKAFTALPGLPYADALQLHIPGSGAFAILVGPA